MTAPRQSLAFKPLLWRILQEMFVRPGKNKAQGLKPSLALAFTARLKSCPDTKHEFFRSLYSPHRLGIYGPTEVVP